MSSLPTTQASNDTDPIQLDEMPITKHLVILRKHLFKIVGILIALFFCLLPFANQTYQLLSAPLRAQLPAASTMIATDVTATFMAPFKLNFFVALMIAMPFILYQLWSFSFFISSNKFSGKPSLRCQGQSLRFVKVQCMKWVIENGNFYLEQLIKASLNIRQPRICRINPSTAFSGA